MSSPPRAATAPGRREAEARATREALIGAALELFTERGYSAVGTEEIVARAKVTRGALYHHFEDKRDLFRAVFERVEGNLMERIGARMKASDDPYELMLAGMRSFLDACEEPAVKQISLTDAPSVLGWQEWREIDNRHGLGLTRAALEGAVDAGALRPIAVEPMAHLFVAALSEGAFVIAYSDKPRKPRAEGDQALVEPIEGMPEGDRPAVRVELLQRDVALGHDRDHLGGECLVELHGVDVVHGHSGAIEDLLDRPDRRDAHVLGLVAVRRCGAQPHTRLEA